MLNNNQLKYYRLQDIGEKIGQSLRINPEEAKRLYQCPNPNVLGSLAHFLRQKLHGLNTTYVLNQQINYTNICINKCLFCSYFRYKKEAGAFELSIEDIKDKILDHLSEPITELHIVGGCHPELSLSYFEDMLQNIKSLRPEAVLKCFTAVEIDHFARVNDIEIETVLQRLKTAGLDMLAGGGAEIFAPEIRKQICPNKISAEKWLTICEKAHDMGIKTNCTMLFGHLESVEHRIEHLDALRRLQDKTGGFVCFIPLPFQTKHNQLENIKPLTGIEELKTIALSRLMLDNIPNIKSYWVMLGLKQAQAALYCGANDLDGTVVEEKVGHMAGADSPQVLARKELEDMIRGCGLKPVQRNGRFET